MRAVRLVVLLVAAPLAPVASQTVHYEGSLNGSTGRYIFSERTTAAVWTTGLALGLGRMTVRASIPVWWQNTPLITGSGAGLIPSGGGGARSRAVADSGAVRRGRHGSGRLGRIIGPALATFDPAVPVEVTEQFRTVVGDPLVSTSLRVLSGRTGLNIAMGAKLPVADTGSFGTGRWDVGGSASVSFRPNNLTLIGFDVSYWHLGDLAELDFRDPVSAGVSVSRLFGTSWGGMASAAAATSSLDGFAGPASIGGALTRFAGESAWGLGLSLGLSETSPDVSGGVTWRIGF